MLDIILHMHPNEEGGPQATPEQIMALLAPLGISDGVIKVLDDDSFETTRIVDVVSNQLVERRSFTSRP